MSASAQDHRLLHLFDRIAATCADARLESADGGWRVCFKRSSGEAIECKASRLLDAVAAAISQAEKQGWIRPEPA